LKLSSSLTRDQLDFSKVIRQGPSPSQLDLSFEAPQTARRVWPVRELVAEVCEQVEAEYSDIWVEGEISNCRPAPSGHLYFTLKDADAQLPVVLFRRQALLLRFKPADGLHVLVRGRVSVYAQRGQLQLVGETIEPVGAGSLQLAFEQLKERLKAEGLFEAARKRPLPAFPRTVGIVTSPTGAVIRDFLNIVGRRHSGLNVLIFPVSVQGEQSTEEIESALKFLNACGLVDLIVVARGGGSLEDLSAFNSERVARAMAGSALPVVSAIGHETDFTIADFVADLRAPTPSAAAELITEAQHRIAERVANQASRLERATRFQMLHARQKFDSLPLSRAEWRVTAMVQRLHQRLDDLGFSMETSVSGLVRQRQREVAELSTVVVHHDPRQWLGRTRERLNAGCARLDRSVERSLQASSANLGALSARLRSLSPLAVLERGYALVLDANGTLIRTTAQVSAGNLVTTRLGDGEFTSRVESATRKRREKKRGYERS
jgi:exodeoxyribonuclease VII large subunit